MDSALLFPTPSLMKRYSARSPVTIKYQAAAIVRRTLTTSSES